MIVTVIIVSLSFFWLIYETKLFSVDLMGYGKPNFAEIMMMGIAMIFIAIGLVLLPVSEKTYLLECERYYKKYRDLVLKYYLKKVKHNRYLSETFKDYVELRVSRYRHIESEISYPIEVDYAINEQG